jgi:hypothetical protein
MNTFGVPYRILCEDPAAANHAYPGNCRLLAIWCSSVGLTGLPTDPEPEVALTAIDPVSGPDNTPITITGANFGTEIGEAKIGGEFVIVQNWADSVITALASQGDKPSGEALALSVARAGGEPVELPAAFTFDVVVVADPEITAVTPANGPQNAIVVITGTGFGPEQGTVAFGLDEMIVQAWADTEITVMTIQYNSNQGEALDVVVTRPDAKSATLAGGYTHDVTAGTQAKGKKAAAKIETLRAEAKAESKAAAKKKSRKSVLTNVVDTHGTDVTMPTFDSGAGIMLRDAGGKILVGPFELLPKTMYVLPIECRNGIEVVPSGMFDITLILANP